MMRLSRHCAGAALIVILPLVLLSTVGGQESPPPAWAYPVMDAGFQRPPDDGQPHRVQGSDKAFTMTEINDAFNPPDWYPNEHPPMPPTVDSSTRGRITIRAAPAQCLDSRIMSPSGILGSARWRPGHALPLPGQCVESPSRRQDRQRTVNSIRM
jgi:hypothetical protein